MGCGRDLGSKGKPGQFFEDGKGRAAGRRGGGPARSRGPSRTPGPAPPVRSSPPTPEAEATPPLPRRRLPAYSSHAPPRLTLKVFSGRDVGVASHGCLHPHAAFPEAARGDPGGARGPRRPLSGLAGSEVAGRPSLQVREPRKGGGEPVLWEGPAEPRWAPTPLGLGGPQLLHVWMALG